MPGRRVLKMLNWLPSRFELALATGLVVILLATLALLVVLVPTMRPI
jgi:uncharacterized membrane protein